MNLIKSVPCGRVLVVGALALVPVTTLAAPAFAMSPSVQHVLPSNYNCRVDTPTGPFFETLPGTIEVDSPDSVKFGEDFKIVIKPPDNLTFTIPQTVDGLRVLELMATRLSYNIPTNATFHGAFLKGGSGFSGADVDEIDNTLRENIRGPVAAGDQLLFPALVIKLEADFPDTQIVTTATGTSFDNPGFEFDFRVQDITGLIFKVTESCFPDQASVVVSTIGTGSENNNNGENHGNKPNKPHRPHKQHKQHKPCDKVDSL